MSYAIYIAYVVTLVVSVAIAIVAGAAALVIAAWLVCACVYLLVTAVGHIRYLVAPTSPLPRATASLRPGDRP